MKPNTIASRSKTTLSREQKFENASHFCSRARRRRASRAARAMHRMPNTIMIVPQIALMFIPSERVFASMEALKPAMSSRIPSVMKRAPSGIRRSKTLMPLPKNNV